MEAFPFAVNYWERHDGRLIQQRFDKYKLSSNDFDGYKTDLYLNITLNEPWDFGTYYCISKNEKGLTKAAVELFGNSITDNRWLPDVCAILKRCYVDRVTAQYSFATWNNFKNLLR